MLAAMDVAHSSASRRATRLGLLQEPLPHAEHLEKVRSPDAAALLKQLDGAIRENDQMTAAAVAHAYGENKHAVRPMFDLLLQFAISEDGRLHAEKYYRTASEEYANTREAFRHRQLVALSRVTASMYGYSQQDKKEGRAPGYEEACKLLRV